MLISVIDLEEGASVVDGELRDDRNRPEDFGMMDDVIAGWLGQDAPGLEASIYCLVTRTDACLHPLVGGRIAGVVGALHLVGAADVAIVGFDAVARLKKVSKLVQKHLDVRPGASRVGSTNPDQTPRENIDADLKS